MTTPNTRAVIVDIVEPIDGLGQGGDRVGQAGVAPPQPQRQTGRLSQTPLDDLPKLVYLTVPEAADYTRRPSINAFRQFAYKAKLKPCRMGRAVLYLRKDVDLALTAEKRRQTKSEQFHGDRA